MGKGLSLLHQIQAGDIRVLARGISLVENEVPGYTDLLQALPAGCKAHVIGITGPPGAGKSTLTDGLIAKLAAEGQKIAVLCVDPSSPFNLGALLGDRIRMSRWYDHPNVFIRSLASRGALGGLHPKIIEITDLVKAAPFDYIIVETVGVGQSEVEISGLADVTVVVLVPESGDEVQTMKAGLMEIADIFVVNKSDRPDADRFIHNLRLMLAPAFHQAKQEILIIATTAIQQQGLNELVAALQTKLAAPLQHEKKYWLLAEKAFYLIQQQRMRDVDKKILVQKIKEKIIQQDFNLYRFIQQY